MPCEVKLLVELELELEVSLVAEWVEASTERVAMEAAVMTTVGLFLRVERIFAIVKSGAFFYSRQEVLRINRAHKSALKTSVPYCNRTVL